MLSLYHALRNGRRRRRGGGGGGVEGHGNTGVGTVVVAGADASNPRSTGTSTTLLGSDGQLALTNDILALTTNHENIMEMKEINTALDMAHESLRKAESAQQFVAMRYEKYKLVLKEKSNRILLSLRGGEGEGFEKEDFDDDDEEEHDMSHVSDDNTKKKEYGNSTVSEHETTASNGNHDDNNIKNDDDDHDNDEEVGVATNIVISSKHHHQQQQQQQQVLLEKLQRDEMALEKVHGQLLVLEETVETMKKHIFQLERKRDVIVTKTNECQAFLIASATADTNHHHDDEDDLDDLEIRMNENGNNNIMIVQEDMDVEAGCEPVGNSISDCGSSSNSNGGRHGRQKEEMSTNDTGKDDNDDDNDIVENTKRLSIEKGQYKNDLLAQQEDSKPMAE